MVKVWACITHENEIITNTYDIHSNHNHMNAYDAPFKMGGGGGGGGGWYIVNESEKIG